MLDISNRWPRRIAATLSLAGALLFTAAARAAAPPPPREVVDVLGERVPVAGGATPTVLVFMQKGARDASAAFARAIDERLGDRPVAAVGVVDVRRYTGALRGLATSYLRRSAEASKLQRRERSGAAATAASERWHLVGDFDGALFSRFGVSADPARPCAFVVDSDGTVQGPFGDVAPVVAAVTRAGGDASAR